MYRRKSAVCQFLASILCCKQNPVTSCRWRNDLRHDLIKTHLQRYFISGQNTWPDACVHVSDAPLASSCNINVPAGVSTWQQDCTETWTTALHWISLQPRSCAGLPSPKYASFPCVYHNRLSGVQASIPICTNISDLLSRTSHLWTINNNS